MSEDVLKSNTRAGPDENNRLQVDVRFLDRERLGEVAGTAVTRCNFLKLGELLGADTLRDRATRVETAAGRRIQRRRRIASERLCLLCSLSTRNFPVSTAACLPVKKAAVKNTAAVIREKRLCISFRPIPEKASPAFFYCMACSASLCLFTAQGPRQSA